MRFRPDAGLPLIEAGSHNKRTVAAGSFFFKPMFSCKKIDAMRIPQVKSQPFVSSQLGLLDQTG